MRLAKRPPGQTKILRQRDLGLKPQLGLAIRAVNVDMNTGFLKSRANQQMLQRPGVLAGQTDLNAVTLYRTLSARGYPEMRTLSAMLGAIGLRLSVTPME